MRMLTVLPVALLLPGFTLAQQAARPNILWITCEDISPHLGCFGDPQARTPQIDRLAREGIRYLAAFAPAGVCAPARSCLITGMYPPSLGTQHMRCQGRLPAGVRCFTEYLRAAGYWCSNRSKTDYNFALPPGAWDRNGKKAHWRGRKPGQPFFSVFNLTVSHEGRIRAGEKAFRRATARLGPGDRRDPTQIAIPPYHPDTPIVRRDWERYHELITAMDLQVGDLLRELDEDGLAEETIVFFFSDHGAGMPRSKRWLYDSGLRVPLVVRFPERYRALAPAAAGATTRRLVSFVDFAPTVLSLAGVDVPAILQGRAFLGSAAGAARRYVFGFRGRMDERYDFIRCVRDERYAYLRNFLPQLPYAQPIEYAFAMPTMREWLRCARAGELRGPQLLFLAPRKPREELYDTWADPHEVHNLATDSDYSAVLRRMRAELRHWMVSIVDLGLLPEADLRTRFGALAPFDAVRRDPRGYPLEDLFATADLLGRGPAELPRLQAALGAGDAAVRWWAATALDALGALARPARSALLERQRDASPSVRLAAAAALCGLGDLDAALPVLIAGLADENEWVRLRAANHLDRLGARARPALAAIRAAGEDSNRYVQRVVRHLLDELGE